MCNEKRSSVLESGWAYSRLDHPMKSKSRDARYVHVADANRITRCLADLSVPIASPFTFDIRLSEDETEM